MFRRRNLLSRSVCVRVARFAATAATAELRRPLEAAPTQTALSYLPDGCSFGGTLRRRRQQLVGHMFCHVLRAPPPQRCKLLFLRSLLSSPRRRRAAMGRVRFRCGANCSRFAATSVGRHSTRINCFCSVRVAFCLQVALLFFLFRSLRAAAFQRAQLIWPRRRSYQTAG